MAEMIPLCVDCKHYEKKSFPGYPETAHVCLAMKGMPNPINGAPIVHTDCGMMRIGSDCSREGKLFDPKGGRQ